MSRHRNQVLIQGSLSFQDRLNAVQDNIARAYGQVYA